MNVVERLDRHILGCRGCRRSKKPRHAPGPIEAAWGQAKPTLGFSLSFKGRLIVRMDVMGM